MTRYAFAVLALLLAQICFAETALWEVSNGENKLLLGASLGVLKQSAYPLPEEFDEAFHRADKLYVERDLTAIMQPDFSLRAMQVSVYRDGRTLKSVLSPEVWQALEDYTRTRDIPSFSLEMFKPAFAVITLTTLEIERLGLLRGVDARYADLAGQLNKPVATLETLDQQITLLEKANNLDANALISTALKELARLSATTDQTTEAWRAGDMATLDQLKAQQLRLQAPRIYKTLVSERNHVWFPQFRQMLNSTPVEFVLVDAIQLTGPEGLLQLLRNAGYSCQPYQPVISR